MPFFNTVPGLVPLKIYSGSTLLTTNVNLINFTGSGVTTTIGNFNDLTINIGGGGTTVNTGSLLTTASFSNPNLTFTKGDGSTFNVSLVTLVPTSASYALSSSYSLTAVSASYAATSSIATSASYALSSSFATTSSFATSASYAPVTPPFPYTGSAQITGSLGVTGSVSLRSGSNLTVNNGLIISSFNTSNTSVGGTPGWTSALRNTAIGLSTQTSVTTQADNTSVGYLSLLGGTQNTAVGAYASQLGTGQGNLALGYYALGINVNTSNYNIALGYQAMAGLNGSGAGDNIAIGRTALVNITSGTQNIALGYQSGYGTNTGYYNLFIGTNAGLNNTTGYSNIAFGRGSLQNTGTGDSNIGIGNGVGGSVQDGSQFNIFIGNSAGGGAASANNVGASNIGIGYEALTSLSGSGTYEMLNTAIGFQAMKFSTNARQNIVLGYQAGLRTYTAVNSVIIGATAGTNILKTDNITIGKNSQANNYSGSYNVSIGSEALQYIGITSSGALVGSLNTAVGINAGGFMKSGQWNIFLGAYTGYLYSSVPAQSQASGSYNTFIGGGGFTAFGDVGDYNTGVGYASLGELITGTQIYSPGPRNVGVGPYTLRSISGSAATRNTAVGSNAGSNLGGGGNNTLIGAYAGDNLKTGSYNILIGDAVATGLVSGSNNTIIGSITGSTAGLNNTLIIGVGSTRKIVIDSAGSGSWTGSLTVTGPLATNNSFLYTSSAFQTTLDTTGFKLTNIASGSQSASIQVSGNGTVGGASYIDFLRVTNTSASAANPNKTFRINGVGEWEVINSAYTTTIFTLTDAGVLNTPGGGTSDRRTKDNINYITESATYTINQLQPAEFEFKNNLGVKRHGFIAQDVLEIKPDLVLGDGNKENGTYGLDYDGILALTVKALQEANTRIDKLEKTIEELKNDNNK
jgi:hypothetical protein